MRCLRPLCSLDLGTEGHANHRGNYGKQVITGLGEIKQWFDSLFLEEGEPGGSPMVSGGHRAPEGNMMWT